MVRMPILMVRIPIMMVKMPILVDEVNGETHIGVHGTRCPHISSECHRFQITRFLHSWYYRSYIVKHLFTLYLDNPWVGLGTFQVNSFISCFHKCNKAGASYHPRGHSSVCQKVHYRIRPLTTTVHRALFSLSGSVVKYFQTGALPGRTILLDCCVMTACETI